MSSLILKRSPIGLNQKDYEALEDSVVVGRILGARSRAGGPPMDVGERALSSHHKTRRARL